MTPYHRRQVLVGGGALAIAGAAFAAQPRRTLADFTHSPLAELVPLVCGRWTGVEDGDVVPEQVDGSIDHGQTLSRRYEAVSAEPLMLVVSYHGPASPELKVHRPETCYTVAGFSRAETHVLSVPIGDNISIPSVVFTARRAERQETVLYWTRVGDRFPQTLGGQRLDFLTEALGGVRADGLLLRVSQIGLDPKASAALLQLFVRDLVLAAPPLGRHLLLGPAAERLVG